MRKFFTEDPRGFRVACRGWEKSEASPRALLLILHGMAEHSGRYDALASYLLEGNIHTYAQDHRGHGLTAEANGRLGHFADESGWEKVLADIERLDAHVRNLHPGVPVFILGHSMGSFLARAYIAGHEVSGVILTGTGVKRAWELLPGLWLAQALRRLQGGDAPSELLDKLSFGSFNKAFVPNRTAFDWLSRDAAVVDAYVADPWCGQVCTAGFFCDLLKGLSDINRPAFIRESQTRTSVLMLSGDRDPVGRNGRDLDLLEGWYRKADFPVEKGLVPGARHEILNEIDREQTWGRIRKWIEERS